jgi:glycosyltransferase involved in cell wall biosynthesis
MNIGVLTSVGETLDAFFPPHIAYWREAGHRVFSAAGTAARSVETDVLPAVSRRPSLRNLRAPSEISSWAARRQLDVIVANTAVASFVARARKQAVPVVYFCHGLHWNTGRSASERVWQMLERHSLRNTAAVVTINSDDRRWFTTRLPTERILYLKHGIGVPLDRFTFSPVPTSGLVALIWVGELSERKRPILGIEVVERLAAMGVPVRLDMFGDGAMRKQVEARAQVASAEIRVRGHSGAVSEELKRSTALLHTAAWEGLPRVGLEAVATGRPVFAFDVKGVRDLPSVRLAADGDVDALARAIATADLSAVGRELSSTRRLLSTEHASRQLMEFLECRKGQ